MTWNSCARCVAASQQRELRHEIPGDQKHCNTVSTKGHFFKKFHKFQIFVKMTFRTLTERSEPYFVLFYTSISKIMISFEPGYGLSESIFFTMRNRQNKSSKTTYDLQIYAP